MNQLGFSAEDKLATCHDIINNIMAEQAATKGIVPRGKLYNIVKDAAPDVEEAEKVAAQAAAFMQNYMSAEVYKGR